MSNKSYPISEQNDEQPPILGSWPRLYMLVIVLHFVIIALLYWLTVTYA